MLQFATNTILMQGFLELEKADIQQQAELGLTALDYRISELDAATHGFAADDDVYDFIQEKNLDNIGSLVHDSTFMDSEINLMLIFSNQGELVFSKAFDLVDAEEALFPGYVGDEIRENGDLLNHQSTTSKYYARASTSPLCSAKASPSYTST